MTTIRKARMTAGQPIKPQVSKLEAQIFEMYKVSQEVKLNRLRGSVKDIQNCQAMFDLIEKRAAWFPISQVGEKVAHMAWMVVHHADCNPFLQKVALQFMKELPKVDMDQKLLAAHEDRMLVRDSRKQKYGTAVRIDDTGKVVLCPVEDWAKLEELRAKVGLEPIFEYVKAMQELFDAQIKASA